MRPHLVRTGLVLAGIGAAAGILLGATEPSRPRVLDRIQAGDWVLRDVDNGTSRRICVSDPSVLLQLAHPGVACSRFVLSDEPSRAQVHYTCPGHGHGDSVIRVETSALFHVDSQGIADNAPFAMDIEARRTGACR